MSSTFFGLEIGRSALQTQQKALDVTGHNIANANTPGFSRQEAVLAARNPFTVPGYNRPTTPGQVGTGVQVEQIRRIRDSFVDAQVRTENKNLGYWTAKQDALTKVEVIINEPSDSSLRSVLDQFWESWQELSKDPESLSVRSVVRQRGIAVAETINHMDQLYSELQYDLNDNIKTKIQDINSIANQIAEINKQILPIEAQGDKANDLRDRRDLLVDKLSQLADVNVWEDGLGQLNVTLGGWSMVRGSKVSLMDTVNDPLNEGYVNVVWADDTSQAVNLAAGELKGLLEARGSWDATAGEVVGIIPAMRKGLNEIAKNIVDTVNAEHSVGYDLDGNTGNNFFKPFDVTWPPVGKTYAQCITVDQEILDGLGAIAAGSLAPAPAPIVGDGANALAIAQLKQAKTMALAVGMGTVDDYYRSQIGKLGVDSQEAQRMVDNQQSLVDMLENQRQAVAGVSLDEEMTNMIKFQKGYEAAARVITVMDEMLDKIINGMGMTR
ncbi:MAG TPA: flagellar hook-associated protein FlgK [Bacillota bacterium]|nr:flagellar hook-associated protein FlgK [Bacillota bacterium]